MAVFDSATHARRDVIPISICGRIADFPENSGFAGCGHCGAGVPANLTRCKDMEASYVSKWLLEAKAEIEMTAME